MHSTFGSMCQRLRFATEGANYTTASANLAFLERDPTERGPRALFKAEACKIVMQDIQRTLVDAERVLETLDATFEHQQLNSEMELLRGLVRDAESALRDVRADMQEAEEQVSHLEEGV